MRGWLNKWFGRKGPYIVSAPVKGIEARIITIPSDSLDDIRSRCWSVMSSLNGREDSLNYEVAAAFWILIREIKALKEAAQPAGPKKRRK